MLDILIKNGTLVDGTGKPAFKADVGIAGDRIVVVADGVTQDAARVVDAQGLHVVPGFVDAHTHSDLPLLADPCAHSKIRQGVTTEVIGHCGSSPAPLSDKALEEVSTDAAALDVEVTWRSMHDYLERLRQPGTALNVVALIGHNTVRGSVLGFADVQPSAEQQAEMERMVAEAMEQGARGMSTGLFYPPGIYARTEEVVGLARVVARYGGIYDTHIRSESDQVLESVAEAVTIGEQAEIRVEVSHLKLSGYRNWGAADQLIAALEQTQSRGVDVGCDQYPYNASGTWLGCMLPYWAQAGGGKAVAARLSDPQTRQELRRDWETNQEEWDNRTGVRTWAEIVIADCQTRPEILGMSIAELAEAEGKDALETAFDLIVATEAQVGCVWFDQSEDNVQYFMRHPMVVTGSDGLALAPTGVLGRRKPHPRSYGTFPRVLGRYVREKQVLSLEEAVKKMTSLTAERFYLKDRGVIREGAYADLVLVDAKTVADRATFVEPHQYPEGIPYVLVNGTIVIDQEQHTGALPGRVL